MSVNGEYSSMDEIGLYDCPMPETFRDKMWMTVSLAGLYFLAFVTRVLFGPLMPEIEKELGFSHAQAGHMFFVLSFGFMLAPVCSGLISSRIDHLGALKISAWLLGFALLPFGFIDSIPALTICLLIAGFAGSLHLPSAVATITAEIQKSDWGKGLGVHQCAPPLAFILAPIMVAVCLQWGSWRQILVSWGGLAIVAALLFTILGRGGEFPGRVLSLGNIKQVVRIRSFWIMVVVFSLAMAGNSGIVAMLPLFFVSERGMELSSANTIIGLSQISGLLVVFVAGMVADKIGARKFMGITMTVTAFLTILIGWAQGPLLLVALFIQPAVLTAFFPAAFAALSRIAPPSLRSVTSAMGPPISFLLGAGLIPVVIGQMAQSYSLGAGIIFAGALMLLVPVCIFFLQLGQYDAEPGC